MVATLFAESYSCLQAQRGGQKSPRQRDVY